MNNKLIYHTEASTNSGISPFDEAIREVSNSKELLIACPYIDLSYVKPFLHEQVNWRIISDVEAWLSLLQGKAREDIINFFIKNTSKIHHYKNLHAKVFLGDHLCLIGSANLTRMGISQRAEMSILLDESNKINEIRQWFENSWSSSSEVNIANLKDYVQKTTIITLMPEDQSIYLNSDAPIIKSKIIVPEEAEQKVRKSNGKKDKEPWNGRDFYVNCSKSEHRNWNDWQRYGFVSAGTGTYYKNSIKNLSLESRVFVFIPKTGYVEPITGYVGVGLVKDTAIRVRDFTVLVNRQQVPILDVPLVATKMDEYVDDLDKSEYLVRVEWIKTVPKSQGYWKEGLFYNQHPACRMICSFTIETLSQHFGLND